MLQRKLAELEVKPRRKGIPKAVKEQVWRNYTTTIDTVCFCCGCAISIFNCEYGHILAHAKGGTEVPNNLRPICRSCNRSMGTRNMFEFIATHNMQGPGKNPPDRGWWLLSILANIFKRS